MLPTAGLSDQVTAVFELFATAAVNIWVCDGVRVTLPGVNATLTGGASDTLALADLVESATLVAVTVTVCALEMEAGAVKTPAAEMLPTAGLSDQVTAVFEVFATVAVNACVCDGVRVTVPGVNATLTGGASDTLALAFLVESATLVAVTVTVCALGIEAGAV